MVATSRRSPLLLSLYISLLLLPAVTLRWLAVGLPLRDCRLRSRYTPGRLGFFPSTFYHIFFSTLSFSLSHPPCLFLSCLLFAWLLSWRLAWLLSWLSSWLGSCLGLTLVLAWLSSWLCSKLGSRLGLPLSLAWLLSRLGSGLVLFCLVLSCLLPYFSYICASSPSRTSANARRQLACHACPPALTLSRFVLIYLSIFVFCARFVFSCFYCSCLFFSYFVLSCTFLSCFVLSSLNLCFFPFTN